MTSQIAPEHLPYIADRLDDIAEKATAGPWLPDRALPGALLCGDTDNEGAYLHMGYGIEKADMRLLVLSDPQHIRLLAQVLRSAQASDAAMPEILHYAQTIASRAGIKIAEIAA